MAECCIYNKSEILQSILTLLEQLNFNTPNQASYVLQLLKSSKVLKNCGSINPALLQKWFAKLNFLMNENDTGIKSLGVLILAETLQQCKDVSLFSETYISWINVLLQLVKQSHNEYICILSSRTVTKLMSDCANFPAFRREVCDKPLARFVQLMLQYQVSGNIELQIAASLNLKGLVTRTTTSMRNHANKIEANCVKILLNSENPKLSEAACSCLVSLPKTGAVGISDADVWTNFCKSVLGSIHQSLDKSFSCVNEEKRYDSDTLPYLKGFDMNLAEDDDAQILAMTNVKAFVTLSDILIKLLGNYEGIVSLPLTLILSVVVRVFDVNKYTQTKFGPSTEWKLLMTSLNNYYSSSLSVLKTLYYHKGFKNFLYGNNDVVSKLSIRTLEMSVNINSLRCESFGMCSSIIKLHRIGTEKKLVELAVKHTMSDLKTLSTNSTISNKSNENMSLSALEGFKKRGKGKRHKQANTGNNKDEHYKNEFDKELFIAALDLLSDAVSICAVHLSENQISSIQKWICLQIVSCQTYPQHNEMQFSDSICRLKLYEFLQSCLINGGAETMNFLQQSIRLFHGGIKDCDRDISSFCYCAIKICNLVAHPRIPALPPRNVETNSDVFDSDNDKLNQDNGDKPTNNHNQTEQQQTTKHNAVMDGLSQEEANIKMGFGMGFANDHIESTDDKIEKNNVAGNNNNNSDENESKHFENETTKNEDYNNDDNNNNVSKPGVGFELFRRKSSNYNIESTENIKSLNNNNDNATDQPNNGNNGNKKDDDNSSGSGDGDSGSSVNGNDNNNSTCEKANKRSKVESDEEVNLPKIPESDRIGTAESISNKKAEMDTKMSVVDEERNGSKKLKLGNDDSEGEDDSDNDDDLIPNIIDEDPDE